MSKKYTRKKKLIKPALQLKLISVFLGTAGVAVLVQAIMMSRSLSTIPELSDAEHSVLLQHLPSILVTNLAVTFGVLIPLILLIGITVTHRIVGPVYRFEQYLGSLARGGSQHPCRIRKGDELQDLCDAINLATEPLRTEQPGRDEREEQEAPIAA